MEPTQNQPSPAELPWLNALSADQVQRLVGVMQPMTYPAGTTIFGAGDRAICFYFVGSGQVAIRYHPYDGSVFDVDLITPGNAFGWSALRKHARYTASAVARTEVLAYVVNAADLHRLISADPDLGRLIFEQAILKRSLSPGRPDCLVI
jgi:CRP-like cAMP-binding protein